MPVRVQINDHEVYVQSHRIAFDLVQKVVREVRDGAFRILIVGPYTHGHLAMGLRTKIEVVPNGVLATVGINSFEYPYALAVEEGAVPHLIFPHPPRTRLRFYWRKVGRVVYPELVHHPGQKGKAYIRKPLAAAAARHGLRIILFRV